MTSLSEALADAKAGTFSPERRYFDPVRDAARRLYQEGDTASLMDAVMRLCDRADELHDQVRRLYGEQDAQIRRLAAVIAPGADTMEAEDALAEALAGLAAARTIHDPRRLHGLPAGTVVRDAHGIVWERTPYGDDWLRTGDDRADGTASIALPALIIYQTPEEAHNG